MALALVVGSARAGEPGRPIDWMVTIEAMTTTAESPASAPWPDDLAPPFLPLEHFARARLSERNVDLGAGAPPGSGRIAVRARATARGQFYDYAESMKRYRAMLYPGAAVEGWIVMRRSPAMACAASFAGAVPVYDVPLKTFGVDYRESPLHAPFDEALQQPGGYVEALDAVLAAAWPAGVRGQASAGRGVTVVCRRAF